MPHIRFHYQWLLVWLLFIPTFSFCQNISSFSPSVMNSGAGEILTIYGNGFGTKNASSYVEFRNADNAGKNFIKPIESDYLLWTDSQIQVKVPSKAGTGTFRVISNNYYDLSKSSLTINYNIGSATYDGLNSIVSLANTNGSGGYTYYLNNTLNNNLPAKESFLRAFNNWICATSINWQIGGSTSNNTTGRDGVNVVRFDDDVDVGVLATTYSYFMGTAPNHWYLSEVDMVFNIDYSWNFSSQTPGSSAYDFESVALHELGHAHRLGHVINTSDVMHYSIGAGVMRRNLVENNINGGNFIMDYSMDPSNGSFFGLIIPLVTTNCSSPFPPTILSFSPASAATGSTITITGTNFRDVNSVMFGGVPASSFSIISSSVITAVVGSGASGNISLTNSIGTANKNGFNFIVKDSQTITFPKIADKTYNDPDFDPGATSSSGLPVVYSSNNPAVATIVNNKMHITGAGNVSITASQTGNELYFAATSISQNLTINKAAQAITFPEIAGKKFNDTDFSPEATSSSGLAITYSSNEPAVAAIVNNKVHITGMGTVTITASQTGDNNYNPATPKNSTLTVTSALASNNFKIRTMDKSCKTSINGAIVIDAVQIFDYVAVIKGNNGTRTFNFSKSLQITGLEAGIYSLCISISGVNNYNQCYDLTIGEPKDLSAYASINEDRNTVTLQLAGGSFYKLELNGKIYTTTEKEITIPLISGTNLIKISTDLICQGIIEKTIITNNKVAVYPNPFKNILQISTGVTGDKKVRIEVYGLTGTQVHSGEYVNKNGLIELDLSKLASGMYVLKLSIENINSIHRIVKL